MVGDCSERSIGNRSFSNLSCLDRSYDRIGGVLDRSGGGGVLDRSFNNGNVSSRDNSFIGDST